MNRLDPRDRTKAVSPSVPTPFPLLIASPATSSTPTNKPPLTKRLRVDQRDRRPLAAWRYAGDLSRMAAAVCAMSELSPHAFTLNLGREIEEAARMSPDGPLTYLQERFYRSLRRQLGHVPPFAFVLETTASRRLHVHGVIAISGAPEALRRALTQAGGLWDDAGAEYQLDLQPVWDGDGWSRYCNKDAARTRKALGVHRVLSLSRDLTRMARDYWATLRASQRARRSAARGNSVRCSLASMPAVMPVSAGSDAPREILVSARVPDGEVSAPAGIVNLATTGPSGHLEHEMAMQISVNRPAHQRERNRLSSARPHSTRLSRRADEGASLAGVNSSGRRLHIRSCRFTSPRQRNSPLSQAGDNSYSGRFRRRRTSADVDPAHVSGVAAPTPNVPGDVRSGVDCLVFYAGGSSLAQTGGVDGRRNVAGPDRGRRGGRTASSPVGCRPALQATRRIQRRPSNSSVIRRADFSAVAPDQLARDRSVVDRRRATRRQSDRLACRPRRSRDDPGAGPVRVSRIFFQKPPTARRVLDITYEVERNSTNKLRLASLTHEERGAYAMCQRT